MPNKMLRVLTAKLNSVLQKVLSAHISSLIISLLIQYSLLISLLVLPFSTTATVRAQEQSLFAGGRTMRDFSKPTINKSQFKAGGSQQDPQRPTITPPTPGIGAGGNGPGGSFNVDPPSRRQGPPPGVRNVAEVLNDARTQPRIPDPIPSTDTYCWPGDPACRKQPPASTPRPAGSPSTYQHRLYSRYGPIGTRLLESAKTTVANAGKATGRFLFRASGVTLAFEGGYLVGSAAACATICQDCNNR